MPTSGSPFLSARNLVKRFGAHTALADVSLDIQAGELVCLLGPSGCGKTTLLRIIAGLETQDGGSLVLNGRDISTAPPQARDYGILFQSYALFPNLTVARNVAYGLTTARAERRRVAERVQDMLDLVGLSGAADKYPSQLSGGQQQRVALARALAPSPSLLLLDEPMSALDARVREHLRTELRALQRRLGITTLMVTHDQEEAMTMADRIAVLDGGKIVQVGTPRDIYHMPRTAFVADFVGEANWLDFTRTGEKQVRVGSRTLTLNDPVMRDAGRLFVRPEAVRIFPSANEGGSVKGGDAMLAQVVDGIFLGRSVRLTLQVDGMHGMPLQAIVPADTGDQLLRSGTSRRCWVELPRHALRAYA